MITGKITHPTIQGKIVRNTIAGYLPGVSSLTVANLQGLLSQLPQYFDDIAAVADGMEVGQYYAVASPNGYGLKKGTPVQIESLT